MSVDTTAQASSNQSVTSSTVSPRHTETNTPTSCNAQTAGSCYPAAAADSSNCARNATSRNDVTVTNRDADVITAVQAAPNVFNTQQNNSSYLPALYSPYYSNHLYANSYFNLAPALSEYYSKLMTSAVAPAHAAFERERQVSTTGACDVRTKRKLLSDDSSGPSMESKRGCFRD